MKGLLLFQSLLGLLYIKFLILLLFYNNLPEKNYSYDKKCQSLGPLHYFGWISISNVLYYFLNMSYISLKLANHCYCEFERKLNEKKDNNPKNLSNVNRENILKV